MKYVAFLRGINVGGHRLIKMEELGRMVTDLGLSSVRTVIASGNVVFESNEQDEAVLVERIEKHLFQLLGYEVKVLLRTVPELQAMVATNPFTEYATDANVKLYVTFLSAPPEPTPSFPTKSEKDGFEVVAISDREIYIATFRHPNGRFGNLTPIEKVVGKYATTRNWNTIIKIATEK